jgi:hypothetical protein
MILGLAGITRGIGLMLNHVAVDFLMALVWCSIMWKSDVELVYCSVTICNSSGIGLCSVISWPISPGVYLVLNHVEITRGVGLLLFSQFEVLVDHTWRQSGARSCRGRFLLGTNI